MLSEFCDHKKVDLMYATLKNNFPMKKWGLEWAVDNSYYIKINLNWKYFTY